jgi:hypothetical protein
MHSTRTLAGPRGNRADGALRYDAEFWPPQPTAPTLSNWLTACAPAFSPACRRIPDLDVARFIHSFHIYLLVRLKMYRDLFWSIEKPSPDLA